MPSCHWKTSYFFTLHVRVLGGCCSLKHGQDLENFVFVKQNRAIWWILFGANLIKVMKISVLQAQPTRLCIIEELHWRAGMIHRPSPWSNTEGDISNNHPLYDSAHFGFLNKCQVYLRLCERRYFRYKVPAEGPGKILKYKYNLRLYPVNFSNKFYILIFNLAKLFSSPFTVENILVPPSRNSKLFLAPLHFAQPLPTKIFMNTP